MTIVDVVYRMCTHNTGQKSDSSMFGNPKMPAYCVMMVVSVVLVAFECMC